MCDGAALHPLVAEILLRRGLREPAEALDFLDPKLEHLHDPYLMKHMGLAVQRIGQALETGESILVSGDYDVDGITASALLTQFLRAAGARVDFFIPNRFEHGYGLTPATVEALLGKKPALVITVDNGITAIDEVAQLHAAGVETILTDHHLPPNEGIPAGIVVNPQQPGCSYPFKAISGVGVAFKLLMALRRQLRERNWWAEGRVEPNLLDCLDLVAIGTVADVVSLTGENRVLVSHGLRVLNRLNRRPGIEALVGLTRVTEIDARAIGFHLAPRINAAGRMADGSLGVNLLLSEEPEAATRLALRLDEENTRRRAKGEEMFRAAVVDIEQQERQDSAGIIVASKEFHEGIIGIVASRLVERYQQPVLVLAENGACYKGSARSIPGLNVTQAISAGADLLQKFGGHAGAAGCTLPKGNLASFRERFFAACSRLALEVEPPTLALAGQLAPAQITEQLVLQMARLEPFGQGNPEPEFLVKQAELAEEPDILKERHLKWRIAPQVDMMGFSLAETLLPEPGTQYAVSVGFNHFRGQRKIQLIVRHHRLDNASP